jgi:hypothetical protein
MSDTLPAGYEFVNEIAIETDELLDLFEDGIRGNEPLDDNLPVRTRHEPFQDSTAEKGDIARMALGIRSDTGKMVAYAAATIDERDGHATVDYMIVNPAETDEGLGKALADEGLNMLDKSGVKTVSFELFGQAGKLVPYLTGTQGFAYDPLNQEYISNRALVRWNDEPTKPETALVIPAMVEDEALLRSVTPDEMASFKQAVSQLIRATTAYARNNKILTLFDDNYEFRLAGRTIVVGKTISPNYGIWGVTERDSAELVASPSGVVMVTERNYEVQQYLADAQPNRAEYLELQEFRDTEGAMRPFVPPELRENGPGPDFTRARYQRVMSMLHRLNPEHLVPEPEDI